MSLLRRLSTFIRKSRRRNRIPAAIKRHKRRGLFSSKPLECKIKLLDGTDSLIHLEASCLGCDLMNQVLIQLDLVERDYFGLLFCDDNNNLCWLDPAKKVKKQLRGRPTPFEFRFRVKFYAIDPDQLSEELTRYHFFLQLKDDILTKKLVLTEHTAVELAAFAVQSELGDYDPQVQATHYVSNVLFIQSECDDFAAKVTAKHKELTGYTPSECEISFLKIIKYHELYGVERHSVVGDNNVEYNLGLAPRGILMLRKEQRIGFYPWNRINMVGFKRKNVRLFIQNRLDSTVIDKCNFDACSMKIAKCIWKSAVEHHSFFRLIRVIRNNGEAKSSLGMFGSRFRYSGRTFYEASRDSARLSRRSVKFNRTKSFNVAQRTTVGCIRVGSRVFARAENSEYFRGTVIGMSDKVYVRCDENLTLAHSRNTQDCLVFDSNPDYSEVVAGVRVIAHWPGIPTFLPGSVSAIDGVGNYARYLIAFDDGDNHWNNLDQIRLLKPPLLFGPGSNNSLLQRKCSTIKTTALINSQIASASGTSDTKPSHPDAETPLSSLSGDQVGRDCIIPVIAGDPEGNGESLEPPLFKGSEDTIGDSPFFILPVTPKTAVADDGKRNALFAQALAADV